jgi:tRNA(His) 5'-end guanylyltransferase
MTKGLRNKCPGTWNQYGGWRRLKIWKNCEVVFTYWSLGALRGLFPQKGEAEDLPPTASSLFRSFALQNSTPNAARLKRGGRLSPKNDMQKLTD